jgi:hypothetical protein
MCAAAKQPSVFSKLQASRAPRSILRLEYAWCESTASCRIMRVRTVARARL